MSSAASDRASVERTRGRASSLAHVGGAHVARTGAARVTATVALLAAGLVACKDQPPAPREEPPAAAAAAKANFAACGPVLVRAATLPPHERAAAIVRGCPVCGPSFEPLLAAAAGHADVEASAAVMVACETGCTARAIGTWRGLLGEAVPGQGAARPWRALADDCPAGMPTEDATVRYASAPWFALVTIGSRIARAAPALPPDVTRVLDPAAAALAIPLPPASIAGTGMIVPPGNGRAAIPWRAVTISQQGLLYSRLAIGVLDTRGWRVDTTGPAYPGGTAADAARGLATLGDAPKIAGAIDDVLLVAPRAAPAAQAIDALAALAPAPTALAVAVPEATALWRGAVAAHALSFTPAAGARLRVDLASARVAAIGPDGGVRASADLPAGATLVARVAAGLTGHRGTVELARALPAGLDTAGLVELLDAIAAAGTTALALAPAGADARGADRDFDPAAFAAALK